MKAAYFVLGIQEIVFFGSFIAKLLGRMSLTGGKALELEKVFKDLSIDCQKQVLLGQLSDGLGQAERHLDNQVRSILKV